MSLATPKETLVFQLNITGLKIPTGGWQISWLFTSMTEELNFGLPKNNSR